MVTCREALELILGNVSQLPPAQVALHEALSLVLAESIVATEDLPPFANSAMDGYAVRAADLADACAEHPIDLEVIEDLPAGTVPRRAIGPGTASRIMTGAALPEGADSVVPVELTRADGERVVVLEPVRAGAHVRRAGEDLHAGELGVAAGNIVRPAEIALIAALGKVRCRVVRRAVVAVLTTGNELIDAAEQPGPGEVRDANIHGLAAQVRATGAVGWPLSRVADTREAMAMTIQRAVAAADVVVTSGGVSVGDHDHVKQVLATLGAEQHFWQVDQKPGKPLAFWTLDGKPVFGLPGNPVSSQLCFEVYVRPALRKMMGYHCFHRPEATATLTSGYRKAKDDSRLHWLRVKLQYAGSRLVAESTGAQGSAILSTLALADALAVIPEDVAEIPPGGDVCVRSVDAPEDH
jgi:molybdopterin molybdotransferase